MMLYKMICLEFFSMLDWVMFQPIVKIWGFDMIFGVKVRTVYLHKYACVVFVMSDESKV